ncbi:MAG: hypothetical protein ACP5N9_05140 [Candidatus Bilamarchaeum sp.]|jgi:RNase P/RNase MRP subunit p30
MFDIIKFGSNPNPSIFGFSKFYLFSDISSKLVSASKLSEAANHKNKKCLIILKDYDFDEGSIKLIADKKNVCFLIDLSPLIHLSGQSRAIMISKLSIFLRFCIKHGAYYSFASFSNNEDELRSSFELENIGFLLGLNRGQMRFALNMLQHYL